MLLPLTQIIPLPKPGSRIAMGPFPSGAWKYVCNQDDAVMCIVLDSSNWLINTIMLDFQVMSLK